MTKVKSGSVFVSLFGTLTGFAQADYARVPDASAGAVPTPVPKIGLTFLLGVRIDNDAAVFLGNLTPHDVIGERLQDITEKIMSILAPEGIHLFRTLQELHMIGNIAPIRVGKFVDILGTLQKKYSRFIADSHSVPIVQVFKAELCRCAPLFPFLVDIEPEAIRLRMTALQVAHLTQSYRIR
jgi:hypothetical protein